MGRRSTVAGSVATKDFAALIAERAYFKAEQRGFAPGHELEDWLAAERELAKVDAAPAKPAAKLKKVDVAPAKPAAKPKKAAARRKNGATKKAK